MTTMQIDRAVVEQALEALEIMVVDVKTTPTAYEAQRQAITAIRAALAQPEPEPEQDHLPAVGEMVAAPVYKLQVSGRLHEWEATPQAFSLPDGHYRLFIEPPATKALRDAMLALLGRIREWHHLMDAAIAAVEGRPCRR